MKKGGIGSSLRWQHRKILNSPSPMETVNSYICKDFLLKKKKPKGWQNDDYISGKQQENHIKPARQAGTKYHQMWHKIKPIYTAVNYNLDGTQNQSFSLRNVGLKLHIRHAKF